MRQLTESAVNEVALDGQYLPLCRGEVRNLEHGPEPDVLPAMHGSSDAIADRADSALSVPDAWLLREPDVLPSVTAAVRPGAMSLISRRAAPPRPALARAPVL